MTETKTTRVQGRQNAILHYFEGRVGMTCMLDDIEKELGWKRQWVTSAIGALRRNYTIESPSKGVYIYKGPGKSGSEIVPLHAKAQVVAVDSDGKLVVQVEGRLYVAYELELPR